MLGNGRYALADSLDILTAELEQLIARHFAVRREIVVEQESAKHWTASIDGDVLYRSPDGAATLRFAHTFAERTPGVEVFVVPSEEWSVRVPDNVVKLHA